MTIVLFASVTLFALVVTSRPILQDSELYAPTPSILQTTLQAVFQILPGKDNLQFDAARFQFQESEQQIEGLSSDSENVATIAPFEISPGDASVFQMPVDDTTDAEGASNKTGTSSAAPLVVLAFSCIAAFLALACIALTLYIIKSLRSQMLASKKAWGLLPRFWRHSNTQEEMDATPEKRLLCGTEHLLIAEDGSAERRDTHTEDKPIYFDPVSDVESDLDDTDEKYQDALDTTPLPQIRNLPLEENEFDTTHVDNSPLPTIGSCRFDQPTGDRSIPLMREWCPSPVSRPAWSVRAIDAPALGLSAGEGDNVTSTPQPLFHPRRRAYRSAVPELDIALAMQLRPGLGMGADSAWMVRFLMTIFGWFAVALTGSAR